MRTVGKADGAKGRAARREQEEIERFMGEALEQAKKGQGRTSPNPVVGAVLVKNGRVIARGHHAKAGGPHAEVVALGQAGEKARGADLYSTLEPCDHHGRTPPCTEAIVRAGIRRVVVGCRDRNPLVSGRGLRRLREAGIEVLTGVREEACAALNDPFFTFVTKKRPFVTLKIAATADGKIAASNGDSRWVTGPKSRERVHGLRDRVDAILVGAGTVRLDDPQLTTRLRGRTAARQPLRVVLTGTLDIPAKARLFDEERGGVLVLTSSPDEKRARALEARGAEVVRIGGDGGRVDLQAALAHLASRDIVHLLVEGGAGVFGGFLEAGLVDAVQLYIAPKVLGEGISWARLARRERMSEAIELLQTGVEQVGQDVLITLRPRPAVRRSR
ncbi:MAG TPA: bifunctional diaminohydroxyphosphoribosylaminopyrimidine deaminase/5-amino-6-(5-phosphoribosylamino)uracil reductase RibD [Myxococcales bacterium]|nr:bifunctional diaminohydroxyphosphoribosylaminopyrimidine deaminase/5-amino-6-(5-phosphoribosylamino)uracil reductase RibD [Myxococcales bacterium]